METEKRQRLVAFTGLVLAALFWAGNAVLARAVAADIGPFVLSFWRWALALLVLLPFGLPHLRRNLDVVRANRVALFWQGLLGIGTFNTLLYIAAHTTTAVNITLVNSTVPIAIAILARFMLAQRTTARQVAGFTVGGLGVLTIVARGDWRVLADLGFREGDMVMVVGVVVWGIYSVLLRRWRVDLPLLGALTAHVMVGVAVLFPLFAWEVLTQGHFRPGLVHLPMFAYLAVFPSVLAFLFWNRGVDVVGPSTSGMFIYLVPVLTALLASTLIGEELRGYHALGGVLILVGLYLAMRPGAAPVRVEAAIGD